MLIIKRRKRRTYPDAGDVVASGVVLDAGRRPVSTCAHAVAIVLDHVDDRQIPQLGQIESLKQLALIRCSIPVQRHTQVVGALVLHCEGNTRSQGCLKSQVRTSYNMGGV